MANTQQGDTALGGLVVRADHLWDERAAINERFGDLHKQVKDAGYDVETFRQIVREHRMDREVLEARLAKLDQYRRELGMYGELGEAAAQREAADGPAANGHDLQTGTRRRPRPFAETPVGAPKRPRGRPRKDAAGALAAARDHLGPGDRLDQLLSE